MTDKDDVHMPIPADQKHVQQHKEPLGEILHRFGHRPGHVHQAEHHRLGVRPRYALEPVVPYIDRIDVRYYLVAVLEPLKFKGEPRCFRFGSAGA